MRRKLPRKNLPNAAFGLLLTCLTAVNSAKVGVIGAGGYIGSRLHDYLLKRGHDVVGYDRNPRLDRSSPPLRAADSRDIEDLLEHDVIVFLGGLTGRAACLAVDTAAVYAENVEAPVSVARRMRAGQTLLFASTSAITEGSGASYVDETWTPRKPELDRYSASMLARERAMATLGGSPPRRVALRFGTVAGVSPGQRVDLMPTVMVDAAHVTGTIHVSNPETMRAFLWLEDLVRAIERIVRDPSHLGTFEVFHLQSYAASVMGTANVVAWQTGAPTMIRASQSPSPPGFSMNASKFGARYNFTFEGSLQRVVDQVETAVPESITPKGAHQGPPLSVSAAENADSVPCPVCGGTHLQVALDLGQQPLANDFRTKAEDAAAAPRYPLKLMRCKSCNHMYLSASVDRKALFEDYLYQSGTSRTLQEYFGWLADKIIAEAPASRRNAGTVIEIASNDGSQLDQFKKRGWRTFGVDPAANLVPLARSKGHEAFVGFWGAPGAKFQLPPPDDVDAIVAQNVFAHVPTPVAFLEACRDAMGPGTTLYIQTSQCQMHQEGQFDTAYHEHISFFTGHSFAKAAELAGLRIDGFELTPIHGSSCLVTFRRPDAPPLASLHPLAMRLASERRDGIDTDFFYMKYKAHAHLIRSWIRTQLNGLSESGHRVVAYGAAAKGMTLYHFLFPPGIKHHVPIDFVVDDAPLKQGRFCPGTRVPVMPTSALRGLGAEPLAVVVLAWNFLDEIATNIKRELHSSLARVVLVVPFPYPRVIDMNVSATGSVEVAAQTFGMRFTPSPLPAHKPVRKPTLLISHFYNEAVLLPYWIQHHAPLFDSAVLIDYNSTDASRRIIQRLAPSSWTVVPANTKFFDAVACDAQVMSIEAAHPGAWKIALTTTEFLVASDIRGLFAAVGSQPAALHFHYVEMLGDDSVKLIPYKALLSQRTTFTINTKKKSYDGAHFERTAHHGLTSYTYSPGRHTIRTQEPHKSVDVDPSLGFVAQFLWTPWPESYVRKHQIGSRIPPADVKRNFGFQHILAGHQNFADMTRHRESYVNKQILHDLRSMLKEDAGEASQYLIAYRAMFNKYQLQY